MERNCLLSERLKAYSLSQAYPFHMPGHKRNYGKEINMYHYDITEISGFDDLHHPKGILKESMEWAASVYGSDKTYYLVNGSSGGILSMVSATVRPGGKILIGRNCHKSVYHGIILNQCKTEYVYPQIVEAFGIQGGILPENIKEILDLNPDIQAVLIVSPTYDGIVSDIQKIAKVIHQRGIPLIVDEAHGAHFPFSPSLQPALLCGADLVVQSLHKTLPSLTQTAVLHVREGYVDIGRLERYLRIYQSSSPSYLFMASIEKCIFEMWDKGIDLMKKFEERIRELRRKLSNLKSIRLLDQDICGKYGVYDVDQSKFLLSVRDCYYENEHHEMESADGRWLLEKLRDQYHLEMEMAGADYVLAITTYLDTEEGLKCLENALFELDSKLFHNESMGGYLEDSPMASGEIADIRMTLSDALEAGWKEFPFVECIGKISAEFIYLYPPGIPIVVPGEVITDKIARQVLRYKEKGFMVHGMADQEMDMLRVVVS